MVDTFPSSRESEAKVVAKYLFPSSRACVTHPNACAMCQLKIVLGRGGGDNYSACYVGREGAQIYCIAIPEGVDCLQSPFSTV